jgi:hypothetical protein
VTEDLIGKTLGGYEIKEELGRGGMATVYRAYQPKLDRYVAIKVLPSYFAHDETFMGRFEREAKAVAGLHHPNILTVHDYGEEGGLPYLVTELVEGGTLKERLGPQWALKEAQKIVGRVGDALAYAHGQGIVHRDIKPSNILMQREDWPLLADFGLAKAMTGSASLTREGVAVGTPEYMSPEQAQGDPADERSDIYSLGVVLYEMVTGRQPFQADTPLTVIYKQVNEPLPPPRSFRPALPEAVEAVILKALAKDPADRYQKVEDMVSALEKAVAQAADSLKTIELKKEELERQQRLETLPLQPDLPRVVPVGEVAKPRQGLPVWVWGVVGVIVLLIIAGGVFLFRPRGGPLTTPTAAVLAQSPTATEAPTKTKAITAAPPAITPELMETETTTPEPVRTDTATAAPPTATPAPLKTATVTSPPPTATTVPTETATVPSVALKETPTPEVDFKVIRQALVSFNENKCEEQLIHVWVVDKEGNYLTNIRVEIDWQDNSGPPHELNSGFLGAGYDKMIARSGIYWVRVTKDVPPFGNRTYTSEVTKALNTISPTREDLEEGGYCTPGGGCRECANYAYEVIFERQW